MRVSAVHLCVSAGGAQALCPELCAEFRGPRIVSEARSGGPEGESLDSRGERPGGRYKAPAGLAAGFAQPPSPGPRGRRAVAQLGGLALLTPVASPLRIPDREPITNRHEGSDHPAPAI